MIRLIVPPLPAVSRPSKITTTRSPSCTIHSCMRTSSIWSRYELLLVAALVEPLRLGARPS